MLTMLTGAAGRAVTALAPVADLTVDAGTAKSIINAARRDIDTALGAARGGAFSSELHAASRNARTGAFSDAGTDAILAGLRELDGAASSTARRRMLVGATLVTGGALGAATLTRGEPEVPMAPGPLGNGGSSW